MTTQAGQVATDPKAERRCSSAFCSHVFSVTPTPPPAHHRDRKGASELAARCGPGRPACGNSITDTLSGATRNTLLRNLIGATPRCGGIAQRRAGGDVHRRPSGHQRSPRQNAHHEQPQLVLRCTAADMLNAERSFRRIKGHSQIPLLVEALHRHAHSETARTPNLLAPPPSVHHRSSPKIHETREYALQFDGALTPVPFRVIPKILPVWVMPNAGHSALYP